MKGSRPTLPPSFLPCHRYSKKCGNPGRLDRPPPSLFLCSATSAVNGSDSRIAYGWDASYGLFPYAVKLELADLNGNVGTCGGTLVTPSVVLTAGEYLLVLGTVSIPPGNKDLPAPSL